MSFILIYQRATQIYIMKLIQKFWRIYFLLIIQMYQFSNIEVF